MTIIKSPIILLPAAGSLGGGITLDLVNKTSLLFPSTVEPEAVGHWLLGVDNPNFIDLVAAQKLRRFKTVLLSAGGSGYGTTPPVVTFSAPGMTGTAVLTGGAVSDVIITNFGTDDTAGTISFGGPGSGAAGTVQVSSLPTTSTGYASLTTTATNAPNGLIGPIDIALDQTICCVFRRNGSTNRDIFGRWNNGATDAGAMLFSDTSNNLQFATNSSGGVILTAAVPPGATGDWVFAAMSHSSKSTRSFYYGSGNTYSDSTQLILPATTQRRSVGIGALENQRAAVGDFAELIIINRALSLIEMGMVYLRSKARMSARSVTVD